MHIIKIKKSYINFKKLIKLKLLINKNNNSYYLIFIYLIFIYLGIYLNINILNNKIIFSKLNKYLLK